MTVIATDPPFKHGRRDLTFRLDIPGVMHVTILKKKMSTDSELMKEMWQCIIDGVDYEGGPFIYLALEDIKLIDHDTVRLTEEITIARKVLALPLAEALGLRAPSDNIKG